MVKIPETDEEARRQRRLAEEAKIAANMEAERARNLARLETAKRLESFNPPVLGASPIRSGARDEEPDLTAGSPEPERRYIPPVDDPARDAPGIAQSPAWDPSLAIPAAQDGSGIFGVGSGGPEDPVPGPLSEAQIIQLKQWKDNRDAGVQSFEMRKRLMDGADPEAAAKALELSQRTGASRLEVQSDPEGYSRLDLMSQVDKLRETSPRTLTWLNAYPDNFDIAHDDTESLSWWEGIGKSFGDAFARTDALKAERGSRDGAGMGALTDYPLAGDLRPGVADGSGIAYGAAVTGGALKSGLATTTSGIYGMARSVSELNDQFASWVAGRKLESVPSQWLAERQQAAKISADEWMPKVDDPTLQGALQGIQSLPTSALTIATGIMTGGASAPIMGAAVAGGVTAGDEYGTAREQGMDPLSSAGYGATQGILEAAWEVPQLKFLIGDINKQTPFGEMLFKRALVQGVTEQGATHTQDFVSWALLPANKDKTIDDYIAERPAAAYQTLIASMVGTGVQTTTAKLLNEGLKAIDEGYAQKRAEEIANMVRAMGDKAADSKLLKRMPDKYREAVAAVTKDGPLENIRVDGEAFSELAQEKGVTVERLAQAFRIDPAEAMTAIDAGQDVVIPSGNYAAVIQTGKKELGIAGTEIHTALAPNIRLRADDFTAKEAEAMKRAVADMASQQEDPSFADAADRVREDSRKTLASTGRFNAETTAVQSAIPAELIITLAERTNQDPEKLWADYKASVESKVQVAEDELSQGGDRAPVEVDDDTVQRASERLTEYEFAVWKAATLEGRSNSDIADDPNIEELRMKQFITQSEKDAMPGRETISVILNRARNKGFSAPEAKRGRGDAIKDDVKRLVKLGLTSKQIHERLGRPPELRNSTNAQVSKIKREMREAGELAQDQTENRGGFTGMNLSQEAIIRLYESANLSTFVHETAHWYLTTLEKMARLPDAHPFVIEQLASIRNWAGKHPEFEIYDANGQITEEGVQVHEAFAETFEAYMREGKAPSTAMRSVFAAFKSWLMRVYKSIAEIGGRVRLDAEITAVFDRALATDEAIAAARKGMDRNAEAMAKAMLDKGVITQRQYGRTKERLLAAREKAEADLMARLMEQYERNQKVWWREEERDVRRDVQSEIDERPEQRAYQVFTGEGWRDTLEDHVEKAMREQLELAQDQGLYEPNANDDTLRILQMRAVEAGLGPLILLFKTSSGRIIAFPGENGTMHHDIARQMLGLGNLRLQHGMYNPRKWPTIEAMNAAGSQAWYDTTGELADAETRELAHRTYSADRHAKDVKRVVEFLRVNPDFANGPLSRIMTETDTAAYAADRGRRTFRAEANGGELAQLSSEGVGQLQRFMTGPQVDGHILIDNYEVFLRKSRRTDQRGVMAATIDLVSVMRQDAENASFEVGRAPEEKPGNFRELVAQLEQEAKANGFDAVYVESVKNPFLPEVLARYGYVEMPDGSPDLPSYIKRVREGVGDTWTNDPELGQERSRQLDAMGFYSAAQEAATRVPDNIWKLGWQAARNALAKGQDGIVPRKTEIEFLGLDGMFGDTKLRGEELKAAVLEHIAAKRLLLSENFARMDPTRNRIREALEAYHDYRMELAAKYGVEFGLGPLMNEDERKIWDKLADEALQAEEKFSSEIRMGETREEALARLERESNNLVRGPGDIRLPGEDVPLFESVIGLPEGVPGSDYQAPRSHVGGKAKGTLVTAHGEERIDDKGQRTLFTGQVQSDMAQQAREDKADAEHYRAVRKLLTENPDAPWFGIDGVGEYRLPEPGEPQRDLISRGTLERGIASAQIAMDAPLLSTSEWTNVAVRAMVYRAARDGFASVSFPTAETSEIIQGNDDAAQHYETNVKGALEKISKQLGGAVRKGAISFTEEAFMEAVDLAAPYETFMKDKAASAYILDITPEMRAKIVAEGFPLFHTGTRKGRVASPPSVPPMRLDLRAVEEQYGPEALAALPPKVRAHSASATDADQFVALARDVQATLKKKAPRSLSKFLSNKRTIGEGNDKITYSGIRDPDGEILAMIGKRNEARGLIATPENDSKKSRSYSYEEAAHAAWEEGYFNSESPPDIAEFLDALRADFDGTAKLYRSADQGIVQQIDNANEWANWFDQNEIEINEENDAVLRAAIETKLSSQAENAIGPDEAAPFFKMPDGRALLEGLKQGPQRDKLIREETRRRMIERHGDIFNDGTIMQAAEAFARNEVQQRQYEIELEALSNASGKQAASNLARETARELLRDKQVREVLNYNQWLILSERWGKKALEAAEKGDFAKAAEAKRYQIINMAMFREGRKLAETADKAVKRIKSFDTKPKRIKLATAGQDYLDQMDQLLEGYDFKKRTNKVLKERVSLAQWFAQKQSEMDPLFSRDGMTPEELMRMQQEEIDRSDALAAMQREATVRNYVSLTVDELLAVRDQADMIARTARQVGSLMEEGERRSLRLAIDDIIARIVIAKPKKLPPESYATFAPKESAKRGRREYMAELRTMQAIIRMIDGMDNGPLAKNTLQKLNPAYSRRIARTREEEKRIVEIYREAFGDKLSDLRKGQMRFPGVEVPLSRLERLSVALNMGTEIARKRLRDGYGWDDATLQSIINSLSAKDWQFVTSMWGYINSLYPEANAAHIATHGVPLTKQDGIPIVTPFGVIDGQYFPLVYDPHRSSRAEQKALDAEAKQVAGRVGTRNASGFTKERVKGRVTMPVLLDFSIVIPRHVDQVVASITTQKALLDVGRVIVHPDVEQAIVERHGRLVYKQLLSALREARNGQESARLSAERALVRLRNGATIVGLGLNMKTAILQIGGHTNSIVRLGGPNLGAIGGLPWLMKGIYRMGIGAQGMQNGLKFIVERSEYMRNRRESQNREMADLRRKLEGGRIKGAMQTFMEQASMFMIVRAQYYLVDGPLWLGAYEKAQASGMSEADAVSSADQTVIDAQGGGEVYQLAGIQRGSPLLKLFTNFLSYSVTTWNLNVNRTRGTNFRNPAQAAAWALDMAILNWAPVLMTIFAASLMAPGGDDDEEDLQEQMLRGQLSFMMSQWGLFGQMGSAINEFSYSGPQGTRAFSDASKAVQAAGKDIERLLAGEEMTGDVIRPLNLALGAWFHYPSGALDRFVRGAWALMEGQTDDPKALLVGPPRE